MLKVLDLFSGIGGFSLGLERAGMRTVAFCEIEPFCRRVLSKHWPEVPIYEDVRELTADTLRRDGITDINVISGGFPCQDISAAGKREGIKGARSGLWREYARLVGELRPSYVIVENSAELLGNGLGDVLGDLATLRYDAVWECIPAAILGAPHGRDRIWLVAYAQEVARIHEPDIRRGLRSWLSDDRNAWPTSPWDAPASAVCRVDDGIPNRVDRTGALGNAVVPFFPEILGRAILAS